MLFIDIQVPEMPAMGRGGLKRFAWKTELELGLIANDRHLFLQTDFNHSWLPHEVVDFTRGHPSKILFF